ncbi:MAG TPA: DNA repair protein RecO [Patescibacteria group bacterium]|nr:DNA repair protein RecO [Patescibacteria group bacterium]
MKENRITLAIVLKRQDYREHDSLVVFYTKEYGKQVLIARGTKKQTSKLAGHIEPLNLVNLMIIPGKGRSYVGGITSKQSFLDLKEDLNNMHWAFLGISWLLKLIPAEGEADQRLFLLLNNYLSTLNQASSGDFKKEQGELVFAVFSFRMLAIIGYAPQTKTCLNCHKELKPEFNYFDFQNGGILCRACYDKKQKENIEAYFKISVSSIQLLRFILDNNQFLGKKVTLNKKIAHEIFQISLKFLQFRF